MTWCLGQKQYMPPMGLEDGIYVYILTKIIHGYSCGAFALQFYYSRGAKMQSLRAADEPGLLFYQAENAPSEESQVKANLVGQKTQD